MINLESMDILPFCWLAAGTGACACARATGLRGTPGGDFERVAIGSGHVKHRPGVDGRIAVDQRIPGRTAVAHPCKARALVHPVLEARRLAGIHVLHLPGGVLAAVTMNPVPAHDRNYAG